MDALTDSTLEDTLSAVPFPPDMCEALLDHTGPMGLLLAAVIALEEGSFGLGEALSPLSGELYVEALGWADATVGALDGTAVEVEA